MGKYKIYINPEEIINALEIHFYFMAWKKKKDRLSGSYSESKTNQRVINT